jgi:hypothetical protein
MPWPAFSELDHPAENILTMVWVSNHTNTVIGVKITNTTGGEDGWFTLERCISYPEWGFPEKAEKNWWARNGPETLFFRVGEKIVQFAVDKDDHVIIYEDSYETFPAKWGFF